MIRKIREARENEEGFTLIELLVVVIIIGILAAIAIPAFLSQRERAYQAELTSGVRNYSLEIEAAATAANGDYPDAVADLPAAPAGTSAGGDITFYYVDNTTGFALCGTTAKVDGDESVTYNSASGGLGDFTEGGTCSGAEVADPEGTPAAPAP